MRTKNALIAASVTLAVLGAGCVKQEVSFTKEVHPILQKNCISLPCSRGEGYAASGFSVQTYESVMKGHEVRFRDRAGFEYLQHSRDSDRAQGRPLHQHATPEEQQLLGHVNYLKDWKVPMLPAEEIKLIRAWIDQGGEE